MARSYTLSMTCLFLLSMKTDKKVKKRICDSILITNISTPSPQIFHPIKDEYRYLSYKECCEQCQMVTRNKSQLYLLAFDITSIILVLTE